jgi:transcription elongation factor GreA
MSDMNDAANDALEQDGGQGTLLTEEGYRALQQELEHLTLVKRPEIAERIRESQEHGEFSEDNNELDEVKFEQASVESRVNELKNIFGTAQILDPKQIPTSQVGIGSVVKLLDEDSKDEFDVRIVSYIEADPNRDLVSNESPMGTVLMGRKAGDSVTVKAPEGQRNFKIISIKK